MKLSDAAVRNAKANGKVIHGVITEGIKAG